MDGDAKLLRPQVPFRERPRSEGTALFSLSLASLALSTHSLRFASTFRGIREARKRDKESEVSITFTSTGRNIHRWRVRQGLYREIGLGDRYEMVQGMPVPKTSEVSVRKPCRKRHKREENAYSSTRRWGICELEAGQSNALKEGLAVSERERRTRRHRAECSHRGPASPPPHPGCKSLARLRRAAAPDSG